MSESTKPTKPRKSAKSTSTYYEGVGRRKSAIARVRAYLTKKGAVTVGQTTYMAGQFFIQNKELANVYSSQADQALCKKPLAVVDALDQYVVMAKVLGGGPTSQIGAIMHGLARALAKVPSEDLKTKLRVAGLLTRDARVRERRKVGTGGKARRVKQSPKR